MEHSQADANHPKAGEDSNAALRWGCRVVNPTADLCLGVHEGVMNVFSLIHNFEIPHQHHTNLSGLYAPPCSSAPNTPYSCVTLQHRALVAQQVAELSEQAGANSRLSEQCQQLLVSKSDLQDQVIGHLKVRDSAPGVFRRHAVHLFYMWYVMHALSLHACSLSCMWCAAVRERRGVPFYAVCSAGLVAVCAALQFVFNKLHGIMASLYQTAISVM